MYLLRTHLLENPDIVFYYKGTAKEKGVSFALNTIIAFEPSDALVFDDEKTAQIYCNRLNCEKKQLAEKGYGMFKKISI